MIDRADLDTSAYQRRQLILRGTIDDRDKNIICTSIRHFNNLSEKLPIEIFIDSQGGTTFREGFIVDAISFSVAPVHAVVEGFACSAAFGILQACHVRKAWPNARFMFHAPCIGTTRVDQDNLEDDITRLKKLHEDQIAAFSKRSKKPVEDWRAWAKAERFFYAEEALEVGMIDEIIYPPEIPVKSPA
jgi:ATP-dependent Clp protease, protease subunit